MQTVVGLLVIALDDRVELGDRVLLLLERVRARVPVPLLLLLPVLAVPAAPHDVDLLAEVVPSVADAARLVAAHRLGHLVDAALAAEVPRGRADVAAIVVVRRRLQHHALLLLLLLLLLLFGLRAAVDHLLLLRAEAAVDRHGLGARSLGQRYALEGGDGEDVGRRVVQDRGGLVGRRHALHYFAVDLRGDALVEGSYFWIHRFFGNWRYLAGENKYGFVFVRSSRGQNVIFFRKIKVTGRSFI